jgi:hypothetical protein
MRGIILAFEPATGEGLVRSESGDRLVFKDSDWMSKDQAPAIGKAVDFEQQDDRAVAVVAIAPAAQPQGAYTAPGSGAGTSVPPAMRQAASDGSGLGIASIVLGVISLFPGIGALTSVAGLICGIIGRKQAKTANNAMGVTLATVGICISAFLLVVVLIEVVVLGGMLAAATSGGFR